MLEGQPIYGMSWKVLSICYSLMKQIKNTKIPEGYIWKYAVMLRVTFESLEFLTVDTYLLRRSPGSYRGL